MEYKSVQIDMEEIADKAEEMLGGLTDTSINLHDFNATLALLISTMSHEYGVDSMVLIQEIENIVNQLEVDNG